MASRHSVLKTTLCPVQDAATLDVITMIPRETCNGIAQQLLPKGYTALAERTQSCLGLTLDIGPKVVTLVNIGYDIYAKSILQAKNRGSRI
jgi:hypothetical protein